MPHTLFHGRGAAVGHLVVVPHRVAALCQQKIKRLDLIARRRLRMTQEDVPVTRSVELRRAEAARGAHHLLHNARQHRLRLVLVAAVGHRVDVEHPLPLAAAVFDPRCTIIKEGLAASLLLKDSDNRLVGAFCLSNLELYVLPVQATLVVGSGRSTSR
eukprot:SAG25_NODE_466_length_7765_cov_9.134881_1_plen_158_part_00